VCAWPVGVYMGRGGGVPLLICVRSKSGSGEARQDCGGVAVGDVRCWRNLRGEVVECRMRSTWNIITSDKE
jgi:hypothetical protein